jgi:hypothetical protein
MGCERAPPEGRVDRLEKKGAKCELVYLTSWFAVVATRANKEAGSWRANRSKNFKRS